VRVTWDALGERLFHTGVDHGMLYVGTEVAVPWNGLLSVTQTADSSDNREYFLDGDKILNLPAADDFAAQLEALSFPVEFAPCAGRKELSPGLFATNQPKQLFGFSYRTRIGNDVAGTDYAYQIHVVYNALAQLSDFTHNTVDSSPSAESYSWNITTVPAIPADGFKPASHIVIDSRFLPAAILTPIENVLYGSSVVGPKLPSLQQLYSLLQGSGVQMHKMGLFGYDHISGVGEIHLKKPSLFGHTNKILGTGSVRMHKKSLLGSGTVSTTTSTRRVGAALGFGTLGDQVDTDFTAVVGSRYGISHFFFGGSIPASLSVAPKNLSAEHTAGRRACLDFELTHYGVGGSPAAGAVTDKNNLITFLQDCQTNGLDFIVCLWHEPYNKFNGQATQALNNLDYTNSLSYYGAAMRAIGVEVIFDASNYTANHHWAQTIGDAAAPGLGWAACALGLVDACYTDWYPNEGNSATTPAGSGIQGTWNNIQDLADAFNLPLGILELGPAPATNAVHWNETDIQAFLDMVISSLASRAAAHKEIGNIIWWATNDNATTTGMYLASGWSGTTIAKYQAMFDTYNGGSAPVVGGTGSVRMKKMGVSGTATVAWPPYRTAVLQDTPSVYYRLGDSASPAVPDAGAGGVNAPQVGTVTFNQTGALVGDSNKAVSFSGTLANHLATAATPGSAYDLGDGPFTIEFWAKVNTINTQQDFVCKSTNAYIVRLSSANHWVLVKSSVGNVFSTSNEFTDTTAWHHIVVTRAAATQPKIYVDGVDQAGTYTAATFANNTLGFIMGEGGASSSPVYGLMDEVAIYKSVLSAARVNAHYHAGIAA
jgi:Concanavalin A-like lectin/glucanases superfamily